MQLIKELLNNERLKRNESKRKINLQYEKAKEFAQYVGVKPPFVLKLFKNFGEKKVLGIKSWIKDAPHQKSLEGLIIWKLKQS